MTAKNPTATNVYKRLQTALVTDLTKICNIDDAAHKKPDFTHKERVPNGLQSYLLRRLLEMLHREQGGDKASQEH
jgi:hypothetical protein